MKEQKFIVGTSVIVTIRDGKEIHGKIVSVDTNGVPAANIKLA